MSECPYVGKPGHEFDGPTTISFYECRHPAAGAGARCYKGDTGCDTDRCPLFQRARAEAVKAKLDGIRARAPMIFKPYIVTRPGHECQVLFPLSELDRLIDQVMEVPDGD